MVPKRIFFTKGVGKHKERLTSFELALRDAGIAAQNLVRVSSIFPPQCKLISRAQGLPYLDPGEVVFLAGFLLIQRIVHSPFGQVLKAIRENEPRAVSLGYDADRYKLLAFLLSATLAGLAGATKSLVFQLASLTDVHWTMSGEVVLMTLLGGMGTIFGPVVGAFVIIGLENYLARFGEWVTVITGGIFVVCVLAFRRGIVGELAAWWARRRA